MSNFPKFILGDNNDEVEWLEEFDEEDTKELEAESENLIEEAIAFYEREITRIEENDY